MTRMRLLLPREPPEEPLVPASLCLHSSPVVRKWKQTHALSHRPHQRRTERRIVKFGTMTAEAKRPVSAGAGHVRATQSSLGLLLSTVTHDKQRAACTMNTSISDWSVCVVDGAPPNLVSEQVGTAQITPPPHPNRCSLCCREL